MKLLSTATIALLLHAGTAQAAVAGKACEDAFDTLLKDASTQKAKCSALQIYSKCLSELSAEDAKEHEPRLVSFQHAIDCSGLDFDVVAPKVKSTKDAELAFTVEHEKGAMFYRHRREEVNVFTMNSDISKLKTDQEAFVTKVTEDAAAAKKEQDEAVTAATTKLTEDFASLKTELETAQSALKTELETAQSTLDTKLTKANTDLDTKLTALIGSEVKKIPKPYYMQSFVHWGQRKCPTGTTEWYNGILYGPHHGHGGSGTSECVRNNGNNGGKETHTGSLDLLYPLAIDHPHGTNLPRNQIVPCAVCMSDVPCIMARGLNSCPKNYKFRFEGWLQGQHHGHRASNDRICVNKQFEGGYGGYDGGWIYTARIHQGKSNIRGGQSMPCGLCCYNPE
jgi:hypothetical protein